MLFASDETEFSIEKKDIKLLDQQQHQAKKNIKMIIYFGKNNVA